MIVSPSESKNLEISARAPDAMSPKDTTMGDGETISIRRWL
jgi:hypothetical protein